jgi:c-di-GMP phosphodiesterase
MERVLVGRQPIFRANMNVFGYELLFRNDETNSASFSDGDQATAEVILNAFTEIGLERVVGQQPAFVNFGRNFIMGGYCEAIPQSRTVIEVLENVEPVPELLEKLERLRLKGYRIALDDFTYAEPFCPLLDLADFVKLDVLATPWPEVERSVPVLKTRSVQLIAEKVETPEQFDACKRIGFDYFQGYFFCRPQVLSSRRMPVNRLATLRLVTKLNNPDIKAKELAEIIGQDVSLSYKLLRYVNSAVCGLQREVGSIAHAAMLVGLQKLRVWASLILFSRFDDKPRDLLITGLVRARMCEKICELLKMKGPERCFLVGLFSVLDAILDQPIAEVVHSLPLSADAVQALLHYEGPVGSVLRSVIAYEQQDWDNVACRGMDQKTIRRTYAQSLESVCTEFNALAGMQSV